MNMPVEVPLKYKLTENNLLGLMVDPVSLDNEQYIWQTCEYGTAKWDILSVSEKNSFFCAFDVIKSVGDKYRCLIVSGKRVKAYSRTLTINLGTFRANRTASTSKQQTYERRGLLSVIDTDSMDGTTFEWFCASLLHENGFINIKVTQETADYGIDILAEKESVKYAIQCKCYSGAIGNKAVQEAYSGKSFYNCMVAVVITNSFFTNAARETARRNSVILWDRNDLVTMIKKAGEQFDWESFVRQEKARHAREEQERQERVRKEQERKARVDQERQEQEYWERERQKKANEERQQSKYYSSSAPFEFDFFKGCTSWIQVQEHYRKLMQIYHPDKGAGDVEYAKAINTQFEKLKKKYDNK